MVWVGQHIRIREDAEEGVFYDTGEVLAVWAYVRFHDDSPGSDWMRGKAELTPLSGTSETGRQIQTIYEVVDSTPENF